MGIATVVAVTPAGGLTTEEVLEVAAAVEADIEHPIAKAICAAHRPTQRASGVAVIPGAGVAGRVGDRAVRVSRDFGDPLPVDLAAAAEGYRGRGDAVVVVEVDGDAVGVLAVSTPLRQEASSAIGRLHDLGLRTAILSGDGAEAVGTVARELGIEVGTRRAEPRGEAGRPAGTARRVGRSGHGGRRPQRRAGPGRRRRRVRHRRRFGGRHLDERHHPGRQRPPGRPGRHRRGRRHVRRHPRELRLGHGLQRLGAAPGRRRPPRSRSSPPSPWASPACWSSATACA